MGLLWVYLEEAHQWCTRDAFLLVFASVLIVGTLVEVLLFKYTRYDIETGDQE
ncbi:MAG: hypothetical protein R6U37_02990 [Dehalococcoidia bacterium]